jgi:GH25 family lysozyme M1 (1,4-beta-N-acetylmuramidase)
MKIKGIDVSQWQGNSIDFGKVKAAGYSFVIIRAGYGRYISQKDPTFEDNYRKAKSAGLNVGAYWYSYAQSEADARAEAAVCMETIKDKLFEYPIYFDLEEQSQFSRGKAFCSALVTAFCGELEKAGYFAGLYISRSPLQNYITAEVAGRYALWVAEYGSKCNYSGSYGMWQYSSEGKVSGISGNVDMDICYVDYPKIIRDGGFNGFTKPKPEAKAESKAESKAPVKGDLNGDGRVDVSDVALLAAHVKGEKKLD